MNRTVRETLYLVEQGIVDTLAAIPKDPEHPISSMLATALSTPPSLAAFGAIQLLMRIAPRAPDVRGTADYLRTALEYDPQLVRGAWGASQLFIQTFGHLYRRSLLRAFLHRSGAPCLFVPSCTEYTERAVRKYGLVHGLLLAADRFRRCNGAVTDPFVDFP